MLLDEGCTTFSGKEEEAMLSLKKRSGCFLGEFQEGVLVLDEDGCRFLSRKRTRSFLRKRAGDAYSLSRDKGTRSW